MDEAKDQNAKENRTNLQKPIISRQNSATSSSNSILSDSDSSSLESVLTDTKNDVGLIHQAQAQSPRVDGYDPTRIPASVFGARPGTPGEWSVASNESLFSIHVGQFSHTTPTIFRSGELTSVDGHDLQQTPPFCRASNDAVCDARRETRTRSHVSTHSFHFPVLAGGRDGGWISSPKMLELKRQGTIEQTLLPPQPLMHIMRRREQPHAFESKPRNDASSLSSWLSRFSYCCVPCRRNKM